LNFEIFFKQQGGKVISYVDLKDSQQEASNQFTRTLVSKNPPDAVVFFPSTDLVSTVMEIFATKGELAYIPDKVKFLGGGTLYTSETLKQGKENVKNLTLTVPWFPEEASSEKFAKKACKRWDEKISWGTSSSYDATQAIIKSISQLKNPSRKDVIEKLKVIELPPSETSGDRLKFIDGERQSAKPVLVRVVRGSSKECGSIEENGFHFEQVTDNQ
ncbi:ABC transporter substrate-binding protein, partial [Nostoc sp. NIES-2111]